MSWSEVKKINSELSTPLNTLIVQKTNKISENIEDYLQGQEVKRMYLGSSNVLNITGKCELLYFYTELATNTFCELTVDGETLIKMKGSGKVALFTSKNIPIQAASTSEVRVVTYYANSSGNLTYNLFSPSSTSLLELPYTTNGIGYNYYFNLTNPLICNSLYAKGSSYGYVEYALLE